MSGIHESDPKEDRAKMKALEELRQFEDEDREEFERTQRELGIVVDATPGYRISEV